MTTPPTAHRTVCIDGCQVGLAVTILDPDQRQRIAASIGWLVRADGDTPDAGLWHRFMNDVIASHVAFTIDEHLIADADGGWWNDLMLRATNAFVDLNELDVPIRRYLDVSPRHAG